MVFLLALVLPVVMAVPVVRVLVVLAAETVGLLTAEPQAGAVTVAVAAVAAVACLLCIKEKK